MCTNHATVSKQATEIVINEYQTFLRGYEERSIKILKVQKSAIEATCTDRQAKKLVNNVVKEARARLASELPFIFRHSIKLYKMRLNFSDLQSSEAG
jgi:hypothetical protein